MLHATPCARAQRAIAASVGSGSPAYLAECQPPASSRDSSRHGSASARPRPLVVRSSVASCSRNAHVVGGELHVELDHPVAVRVADAHRRQRVLGRELAGAAVRDQPRVRPGAREAAVADVRSVGVSGCWRRSPDRTGSTRAGSARTCSVEPTSGWMPCGRRAMQALGPVRRGGPACRRPAARPSRPAPANERLAFARTGARCSGRMPTVTGAARLERGAARMRPGRRASQRDRAAARRPRRAGSSSPASR